MPVAGTRVGVLLAGCGTHDGTEIGEALLTLLELERRGAHPIPLAPPGNQMHVVDHATGDERAGSSRSMAAEAARITRGKVEILGTISTDPFHALIIPGGSGVIKNLMTGTLDPGSRRELLPVVRDLLVHFLQAGKPIGIMSVANFLLPGLVDSPILPERAGTPGEPLLVDPDHRLVYAPAFLTARSLAEVAEGVRALVEMVLHYADETRT
ncbi:MAG: isoprenoid biosynthesis protein ElbB [Acidobacteria bacterium]|nr:MAG: isoprenoid biosynthesis protein ElbB [Acidobacteriota bacterium]